MKTIIAIAALIAGTASAAHAATPPISITNVWSRPATGTAVIYATIRNDANVPDRLIAATSPVATSVELHQSTATKMPASMTNMGNMNMPMGGSIMSMKSISNIPVPAHGSTSLAPGGYHLMLNLRSDLHAEQRVPLRLHFAHAGWIAVVGRVRPI